MSYQAAIFDLDGTLLDSLHDLAESVNYALTQLGLPTHSIDSYRMRVGNGQRKMVSRALGPDHQHLLEQARAMQIEHYTEHYCDHTRPYTHVMETLAALKERGYRLAVLSNKPDDFTQKLVKRTMGRDLFDVVRGHCDGTPLKPDPTSALQVAAELNVEPAQVAYLGDTSVDMQTAVGAGFFAIGVLWGFRDRQELEDAGAQALIDSMADLPGLLGH